MFTIDQIFGDMSNGFDKHEVPSTVTVVTEVSVVTRRVSVLISGAHINTKLNQRLKLT